MKLLVLVVCLLSERFLMHSLSYQRFYWFDDYAKRIASTIEKNNYFTNPWLLLAAIVLPITLIVAAIYGLLHGIVFGFAGIILSIVIFFYCLGPVNAFYPIMDVDTKENTKGIVGSYFAAVNTQLFAPIFWYIMGGPVLVIIYRLITLSQHITPVKEEAVQLTDVFEWIPARITVLLYLIVGNFQSGFSTFRKYLTAKPDANNKMLSDCGLHAVKSDASDDVPMPVAESLVEHATIVLLVFIALFTLVAWM